MTRLQLLERLKELQESSNMCARDMHAATAMMSKDALAKHVELCEQAALKRSAGEGASARH